MGGGGGVGGGNGGSGVGVGGVGVGVGGGGGRGGGGGNWGRGIMKDGVRCPAQHGRGACSTRPHRRPCLFFKLRLLQLLLLQMGGWPFLPRSAERSVASFPNSRSHCPRSLRCFRGLGGGFLFVYEQ